MIEKVNEYHPDKIADRIAGATVDLGYIIQPDPKIAVEVLIGHGVCHTVIETSVQYDQKDLESIIDRICPERVIKDIVVVPQDLFLAQNQKDEIRCGDNGIFKGVPLTGECRQISSIAKAISDHYNTDGKYILDGEKLIICQSHADEWLNNNFKDAIINPLGNWEGGINTDTGATNRKLGSDMGESVTGGGLHGKDLSKADVSINIFCFLMAQQKNKVINASCAIGDTMVTVDGVKTPYKLIVETAREWITNLGGFEKLAEWGLF